MTPEEIVTARREQANADLAETISKLRSAIETLVSRRQRLAMQDATVKELVFELRNLIDNFDGISDLVGEAVALLKETGITQ